jgi:hypothetical protein
MDSVQGCSCINIPSSQTYIPYYNVYQGTADRRFLSQLHWPHIKEANVSPLKAINLGSIWDLPISLSPAGIVKGTMID